MMVSTYSHQRRLNAVKALLLLAAIVALILAPRLVRAELIEQVQRLDGDTHITTPAAISPSLSPEPLTHRNLAVPGAAGIADTQANTP